MTAGLPGTGIGGIFYLLSAFLMPIQELRHTFYGRSNKRRWKFVGIQLALSSGIMGGFWLMGWFLGLVLRGKTLLGPGHSAHSILSSNIFKIQPVVISLMTLLLVLLSVQILNFFISPAAARPSRFPKSKTILHKV